MPELQQVACLILSMPSSSSICERINSEFAFVKDTRRNRLAHDKANKLVGLFHNLRLLHRMRNPMYVEPAVGWNEEDSETGLMKFGVMHYERLTNNNKRNYISPPVRPTTTTFIEDSGDGVVDSSSDADES